MNKWLKLLTKKFNKWLSESYSYLNYRVSANISIKKGKYYLEYIVKTYSFVYTYLCYGKLENPALIKLLYDGQCY